jgi:putative membrane protein
MSATSAHDAAMTSPPRRARRARAALSGLANWRFLLVSIVVNALVLALVIAILPGLRFEPTRPVAAALLLSVVYGLVKAYVKPVIQFLALKYLFATYGLITILINALLLWLVALLSMDTLVFTSLLALVIAGALAGFFGLILESVFGLTPPVLDRTDEDADA